MALFQGCGVIAGVVLGCGVVGAPAMNWGGVRTGDLCTGGVDGVWWEVGHGVSVPGVHSRLMCAPRQALECG